MSEVKYIVRVANTDLDGRKSTMYSLTGITGVSIAFANAACAVTGVSKTTKLGSLSETDVKKLNDFFASPKVPTWMLNRQKDYETGANLHLMGSDVAYTLDNDLKRLKKLKTYRGMRHQWGLTVRGQQTKSNHRRSKAKKASAAKKGKKSSPSQGQAQGARK
jgi:small subunit ribosomal protein S13